MKILKMEIETSLLHKMFKCEDYEINKWLK